MLNYIWTGLIALSLIFALSSDAMDLRRDKYRNAYPLPVVVTFPTKVSPGWKQLPVTIAIQPDVYQRVYRTDAESPEESYSGEVAETANGYELQFAPDAKLPPTLATIRDASGGDESPKLRGVLNGFEFASLNTTATDGQPHAMTITFEPVRFVKLKAITQAAFDFSKTAVKIAIELIGGLALWLGLMRIGEKAGLIELFVRLTQPVLRPLFPEIPKGHPAMGMVALNLTANMLGLGNAATPFGIKAMEELQALNPKKDTATNAMVMLLALNTAGVQLVPPAILIAILGVGASELLFPILAVTITCAIIAAFSARLLGKLPIYRRSDPALAVPTAEEVANG